MMLDLHDCPPEAILFDCDGTLLLTADLHFSAISQAAFGQGATMPRDWYMSLTGMGRHDLFACFANDFQITLDIPSLAADSIALTVALADQARENPPVAALARRVSGRLPIAVVTNSEAAIARAVLGRTALLPLFDAILTIDDVTAPKPAPDLFLLAAERLGVTPSACLVLEDSSQGIEAAQRAGMRVMDVRDDDALEQAQNLFLGDITARMPRV
jgi:HAD superfamily hydrolase (TIGR01509 family)